MAGKKHLTHLFTPLRYFFKDSRSGGVLLITCTVISIILSNTSMASGYLNLWKLDTAHLIPFLHLPENSLTWVNDLLMSSFFFLVGMEIKRELLAGELASVKKSLLPILGALGGMVIPAIIFTAFNSGTPFHHGWGIPMATDIAFSLGVLSLLGKRVPVQLKIFLAALAIIDDLGAVLTIALFYSSQIKFAYLIGGALALASVLTLNRFRVKAVALYLIPAAILWYCLFNSGVHATIAGVVMAFAMPLSQLSKLEKKLFHPVNFIVMPLFALANTAIVLPSSFGAVYTSTISIGVMLGLILGKPLGIFLFSFLGSKSGIASLPSGITHKQLLGIGMMGGIGFTMSIFTSTLSYNMPGLQTIAKVSIISASLLAGIAGYLYLSRIYRAAKSTPVLTVVYEQDREEYEKVAAIA